MRTATAHAGPVTAPLAIPRRGGAAMELCLPSPRDGGEDAPYDCFGSPSLTWLPMSDTDCVGSPVPQPSTLVSAQAQPSFAQHPRTSLSDPRRLPAAGPAHAGRAGVQGGGGGGAGAVAVHSEDHSSEQAGEGAGARRIVGRCLPAPRSLSAERRGCSGVAGPVVGGGASRQAAAVAGPCRGRRRAVNACRRRGWLRAAALREL